MLRHLPRLNFPQAILLACLLISQAGIASTDPELRRLLHAAIHEDNGFADRFDAEVWLLDMSRRLQKFVPEPRTRIDMLKQIH